MIITSAKYLKQQNVQVVNGENTYVSVGDNMAVTAVIDGETLDYIPLDTDNTHYQAILDWVAEGNTIADAS